MVDRSRLHISFTAPLRLVNHSPLKRAQEVRIELSSVMQKDITRLSRLSRESQRIRQAGITVSYTAGNAGRSYLTVTFPFEVEYEIQQGGDFRSLTMFIISDRMQKTLEGEEFSGSELLARAQKLMDDGKFQEAIRLLTRLSEYTDSRLGQLSQEMLADARLANNQLAHAKAEYERYLELYPDGKDVDRVNEKLTRLLSGSLIKKKEEVTGIRQPQSPKVFGDIYQTIENRGSREGDGSYSQDVSIAETGLDLNYSKFGELFSLDAVVNSTYEQSLIDGGNERTSVSSMYLEAGANSARIKGHLGRKYEGRGGIWGRYDGLKVSFGVMQESMAFNLLAGYPVDSVYEELHTDRYLVGMSLDLFTMSDNSDLNLFFLTQEGEEHTERQAIGGEFQMFRGNGSLFGVIDYDMNVDDFNLVVLTMTYQFQQGTTLTLSGENRMSPFFNSSSSVYGYSGQALGDMLDKYSDDELIELSSNRSAESTSAYLGIYHLLGDNNQVGMDLSWARLEDNGVTDQEHDTSGSEEEYLLSLFYTRDSLLTDQDVTTAVLRHRQAATFFSTSGRVYSRIPMGRKLFVIPEAFYLYRTYDSGGDDQEYGPELRLEYTLTKTLLLDIECSYTWLRNDNAQASERIEEYYLFAGIYWSF